MSKSIDVKCRCALWILFTSKLDTSNLFNISITILSSFIFVHSADIFIPCHVSKSKSFPLASCSQRVEGRDPSLWHLDMILCCSCHSNSQFSPIIQEFSYMIDSCESDIGIQCSQPWCIPEQLAVRRGKSTEHLPVTPSPGVCEVLE
jgi:hypothetical protein